MRPSIAASAAVLALSISALVGGTNPLKKLQPLPIHVVGTHIVDSNGQIVLLRGVNAASMEWTVDGEGHILNTVNEAIKNWHANIIRIPLAQDRWFGVTPQQTDKGAAYRQLVRKIVDTISSQDCYVILDLHWNDAGVWGEAIGQHVMPDMNSETFWRSCAAEYRNEPAVLFDLYNEPHDVPWDVWLNGGSVRDQGPTVRRAHPYQTPGMQALLNTVRDTGADNVIVCGGLDWAYDMSGFLNGHELKDPTGNGVIYANHTYPIKGDTMKKWMAKMDLAIKKIPIIVSEFGAQGARGNPADRGQTGTDWVRLTMDYIYQHNLSYTAWDLHPAAGPTLVSNWNYTPSAGFGTAVKYALTHGHPEPARMTKK